MINENTSKNQAQIEEDQKAKLEQQLNQLENELSLLRFAPSIRRLKGREIGQMFEHSNTDGPILDLDEEGREVVLHHTDEESFQIELLQHLINELATKKSQGKLTSGEFVEVSHHWADWPSGIARKASKEVRTILKRRGFDANFRLFHPISGNYGWVIFFVRPKPSLWQLFREFTQAL